MMQSRIGIIVAYKTTIDLQQFLGDDYFLVGVERGCLAMIEQGVRIDLAISDFDHVSESELATIKSYAKETIVLNPEKDFLDGIAAINYLDQLGIKKIKFFVKPTQRFDMNLSIIELMKNYDDLEIMNEDSVIQKIKQGSTTIPYQKAKYVSFYTLADNNKITLKKFKYEVDHLEANLFSTRFLSNQFLENQMALIENEADVMMIIHR